MKRVHAQVLTYIFDEREHANNSSFFDGALGQTYNLQHTQITQQHQLKKDLDRSHQLFLLIRRFVMLFGLPEYAVDIGKRIRKKGTGKDRIRFWPLKLKTHKPQLKH